MQNPVTIAATPSENIEQAATNVMPAPSVHVEVAPASGVQNRVMEVYILKLNLEKAVRDGNKDFWSAILLLQGLRGF